MVGVGTNGSRSALARVVVVDGAGRVVLDEHVKPKEKVTDFRTKVSGVTRADLTTSCIGFSEANASVASLVKDKVLVGHGLENDLKALMLSHPMRDTRDSALYPPLLGNWKARFGGARKLKDLAKQHLGRSIQVEGAPHDPAEDARSALDLYKKFAKEWDAWSANNSKKARQRLNRRRCEVMDRGEGCSCFVSLDPALHTGAGVNKEEEEEEEETEIHGRFQVMIKIQMIQVSRLTVKRKLFALF